MSVNIEGPVFTTISEKLNRTFDPIHMDILNESYMHNVPKGSETHFKVIIVSEKFKEMKNLIQRHRAVNDTLAEELSRFGFCVLNFLSTLLYFLSREKVTQKVLETKVEQFAKLPRATGQLILE